MYSYFQKHYRFRGVVFSKSPIVIGMCRALNITVVDHYQSNKFGLPLIRDLFQQSYHLINSRFYGYINSDIIMSPTVFNFLTQVEKRIQKKEIPENVLEKEGIDG